MKIRGEHIAIGLGVLVLGYAGYHFFLQSPADRLKVGDTVKLRAFLPGDPSAPAVPLPQGVLLVAKVTSTESPTGLLSAIVQTVEGGQSPIPLPSNMPVYFRKSDVAAAIEKPLLGA